MNFANSLCATTCAVVASGPFLALCGCVAAKNDRRCDEWNKMDFHLSASVEEIAACIALGVDLDVRVETEDIEDDDHISPLLLAANQELDPAVAFLLLQAGANPQVGRYEGMSVLHFAAGNTQPSARIFSALIDAGADVTERDRTGLTPLHRVASVQPLAAAAELLLAAGASPHARNHIGRQPLHFVGVNASSEMAATLIAAGADPNAADNGGMTPLHTAVVAAYSLGAEHLDQLNVVAVAELLAGGADPGRRDAFGATPLHQAVHVNSPKVPRIVALLVGAGADVSTRDIVGSQPIHQAAAWNEDPAVLRALFDAGANVHALDGVGNTALHRAVYWNANPHAVAALLQAGARPNAPGQDGDTPLHWALRRPVPNVEMVAMLLKAGADPMALNDEGEPPRTVEDMGACAVVAGFTDTNVGASCPKANRELSDG